MIEDRNLKPGTVLVARYKKAQHRCEVVAGEEGRVCYRLTDGREFRTPSSAGSAVMGGMACNGWRFWTVAGAETAGRTKAAKKTTTKLTAKAKSKAKVKTKATRNGRKPAREVACGECGETFPTAAEASEHVAKEHPKA